MKNKKVEPDDYFRRGPLEVARFGKNVVIRSHWTEEEAKKRDEILIEKLPELETAIDVLIEEAVSLILRRDPLQILHRAYWAMAGHHMNLSSESEADEDGIMAMRTLEYIQNVIGSHSASASQEDDISEEEWATLSEKVSGIYKRINHDFLLADSVRAKTDEGFDDEEEQLRFRSLIHWMNVRGERYSIHEKAHLEDLLICQSEIIESLFGVSAKDFIEEIHKIHVALTEGVGIAANELSDLDEICFREFESEQEKNPVKFNSKAEIQDFMKGVIARLGLEERHQDIAGRFFGYDLFDLEKSTTLPIKVLERLSWRPGEETTFFSGEKFKGWPLKVTPISRRPFISIGGGFYCFNVFPLFDNLYRTVQRVAFEDLPSQKQKWIENQAINSENVALGYFEKMLPGCKKVSQVYYKWFPSKGGKKKEWCETDGIVIYGDHLIVLEVKAGSFTYTSPYDDFDAHAESMKTLILKPAEQGARFIEYLKSEPEVTLFDSSKNPIASIASKSFRRITICALTLDPFTEIAAQIEHLSPLGISFGDAPVWSVSLDDLRVCSDIFISPLIFLHYLEKRVDAMKSKIMHLDDELDHVGLYLEHNDYILHASDLLKQTSSDHLSFNGYRKKIDTYFHAKLLDPQTPNPLSQQIPEVYLEILEFCRNDKSRAWTDLAAYLLDMSGNGKDEIAEGIQGALERQFVRRRIQMVSTTGQVRITIACWQPHLFQPHSQLALDHAKTELFFHGEDDRKILELFFDPKGKIQRMDWHEVTKADVLPAEVPRYQKAVEEMKSRRMDLALERGEKFGRNSPCPCGSGLKYKKCCLNSAR